MSVDQEQTFLYDLDGQPRAVARGARERFEQENPGATRVRLFSVDGKPRAVAADAAERFAAENPGAEPVYLFDRDGSPQAVAKSKLGAYVGERAQAAQKANDQRVKESAPDREAAARERERAEAAQRAAAIKADTKRALGGGGNLLAPTTQIGQGLQDAAAGIGYALPRLAGAVADLVNPDPLKRKDVISGQTVRVSPEEAGYAEDPYRPGPAARLRDRIESSEARRLAASAPETRAGEIARGAASAAGSLGALALSGGAAAPMLAAETGIGAMERQAEKGAGAGAQLGALAGGTALGALATAAGGAPGRLAGRAVQGAAIRAGAAAGAPVAKAVTRGIVAGNVARGAAQGAVDMAALKAAGNVAGGDPALQGVGPAALGGAVMGGAARGVSSIRGARYLGEAAERLSSERGAPEAPARGGVQTPPRALPPAVAPPIEEATLAPAEGPRPPALPPEVLDMARARGPAAPESVRGYVPPAERMAADAERLARVAAEDEAAAAVPPEIPVEEVPPQVPEIKPRNTGSTGTVPPPAPVEETPAAAAKPKRTRAKKQPVQAPVSQSPTPPQTEATPAATDGSTPYRITDGGLVVRRDGKRLEPGETDEIKKIAKAAGVKLYKDRVSGRLRASGFGLGGEGNQAAVDAFDGKSRAPVPEAPAVSPSTSENAEVAETSPEYQRVSSEFEALDAKIKRMESEPGFTRWRNRPYETLVNRRHSLAAQLVRMRAETPLSDTRTQNGVVVGKGFGGQTVYAGFDIEGSAREKMPEQREWVDKAVKAAAANAPSAGWTIRSKGYGRVADEVRYQFTDSVRFNVPGDGSFTIPNEKHAIEAWGKDIKSVLSPSGFNAKIPSGGGRASRGLEKIVKSPDAFSDAEAEKLLAPFLPKMGGVKQSQDGVLVRGEGTMVAFVRGKTAESPNKWTARADLSKIADYENGLPVARDGVEADVQTLLRDVREAAAVVDLSKEQLEVPSESKARAGVDARNAEYAAPGTVRLMQGRDGRLFIAAEAPDGSTVETGDMNGARELGMFDPAKLEKALALMAQTGSGRVTIGFGKEGATGAPFILRGDRGNAAVALMGKRIFQKDASPASSPSPPVPSSGTTRANVATAAPSLVGDGRENPAPAVTDTLGAPKEGAAQKRTREDQEAAVRARTALVKWDAGEGNEEEMRACISELEGRSLYASARDLKRAMGDSSLSPGLSTAGAHEVWPAAEPGALSRVSMRDLVDLATAMGSGRAPLVVKKLRSLGGEALGTYHLGGGPITLRSDLWQLVDAEQRRDLRAKAGIQALEEVVPGGSPTITPEQASRIAARERELYDQFLDDAIRANAMDDAPVAAQVLAHELGHFLDDLPDGLRNRGNILGRLASLKDYLASTLFKDPRDAAGRDPFLTPKEREDIAKEAVKGLRRRDFGSDEEFEKAKSDARRRAIDAAILERGFASAPAVRAELDDLIAWYRQSDHAPEYFRKGEEMFAEAFSAYLNYPMTARAKAPTFCDLLEHWGSKKGEWWEDVRKLQRREPVFAETQGPWRKRFMERMRATTAAWYELESFRPKDVPGSLKAMWDRAANYALAAFSGELRWVDRYSRILEKAREGRIRENGWGTPEGARAREAVHAYTHASTRAEEELVRFRSQVLPVVEQGGATIADFDVYLTLYRVANELLGADKTRGAMNLPNPAGITPAAAKAELDNWRQTEPRSFEACRRAQEIFAAIRRDTVLDLVQKYGGLNEQGLEQMLANDAYARFLHLFAPKTESERRAAQGEMRATSGIRRRSVGSLAQNVSPSLATLLGDAQVMFDVSLNGARREAVALLKAAAPDAVRPAKLVWDPARKSMMPKQINTGSWRTVVWLQDGKPVGADVRAWAAYGLRGPQSKDPTPLDPVVDALEWAGRQSSRAVTFLSYTFSLRNPVRDRSNMLRTLPAAEDASLFEKAFGPVPTVVQSLWSGMGTARETGENVPQVLLDALRAGALPGATFSGRSHRADTAAKLLSLFQAGTDPEKYRAAADDVVRSLGLDPALLQGQKRLTGTLGKLLEGAARAYTWLPARLSRTETNAKVAGYEAVKLAHPDWPEARVAEYVARNVGTPDPTAPSALAQIRGLRAFLPFYTMTYRGFADGYLAPWRDQAGLMALRLSTHAAWRFLTHPAVLLGSAAGAAGFGGGIVGYLRSLAEDEDGDGEDVSFYKRGLLAAADALEFVGRVMRSVSPFDRSTGFQVPLFAVDEATKKYAYLQLPTAQELAPIDAIEDFLIDQALGRDQMPASQAVDAIVNGLVPNVGVVPRSIVAATSGVDLGQGLQEIHRDPETATFWKNRAEALGAQWDIWTGRGWGALQWRNGIGTTLADDEKTAVEKWLALPGVVNTIRPFLRVTNQGDAQTAKMINAWKEKGMKQNNADAKEAAAALVRIDDRFERGVEDAAADARDELAAEEARERIAETGASAGDMIRGAKQRQRDRRTLSPSERAIRSLPRRMQDEARERFGVPEPD